MYYLMDIMYSHVIDDEYYEMCTHAPQLTKSFFIFSEVYRHPCIDVADVVMLKVAGCAKLYTYLLVASCGMCV